MRLLKWNDQAEFVLTDDLGDNMPAYAILSHTWGADGDEVNFTDLRRQRARTKAGYAKINFCGQQARRDGIEHFWVDTCCINKHNENELSEAIRSMFCWYQGAEKCYVYLGDVPAGSGGDSDQQPSWVSRLRESRWFTRGWTLQELLAPSHVDFFSCEGALLGTKSTLAQLIHEITTIPLAALQGAPLAQFPVDERMRWAAQRHTTRPEDRAYCLQGVFGIHMPLMYGEGDNAFRRLQMEIREKLGTDILTEDQAVKARPQGLCLTSAPLIAADEFVGRIAAIDAIHRTLRPDEDVLEQRRVVLGGMGGIGKTQLAIAYARQHQHSYEFVLWLNAASKQTLYASLRAMAHMMVAATDLEKLDNQHMLGRVHQWLSHSPRWLLIFDNYDDPDQFDIDGFYPPCGHGSTIVTTRRPDMLTGQQIPVSCLTDISDSLRILQTRSGRQDVEADDGAYLLAKRLDGLPLALATAGAYLRRSTISFQHYLETYNRFWRVDPREPPPLQDYRDRTLYTTWNVSYSQLETDDPTAARMLTLLAYFDHQEVWYNLLQIGLSRQSPAWLRVSLAKQTDFESAMSTLVGYCLVEVQHAKQSYSIHRCIHDWTLGALNTKVDTRLYWYAFDCVVASINDGDWDILGWVQHARIGRHAVRLTHHRLMPNLKLNPGRLKRSGEIHQVADLLREQHQLVAAKQMYRRALAGLEKVFRPGHEARLSAVIGLSVVCMDQGKLNEAEQMCDRARVEFNQGPRTEPTILLKIVNNLGRVYSEQGRLREAEGMFMLAFLGYDRVLGSESSLIYDTIHNLGNVNYKRGKLKEAEGMYKRALFGYQNTLGPEHPSTLETINNLGLVYKDQGRFSDAMWTFYTAMEETEKALGAEHSSTLRMAANVCLLYKDHGDNIDEFTRAKEGPASSTRVQVIPLVGMLVAFIAIAMAVW